VVAEAPPGTAPQARHFPRRNRVIAGWGRAVVVVEAGERSGALVTARLALDEGREVLAVPGHPAVAACVGTNRLIREGAALVRDAADVLEALGLERVPGVATACASPAGHAGADELLDHLPAGVPATLDELQERSGRPPGALLAALSVLEVAGRVRRLPGALYLRA
jgi:DNA processing protein